MNKKSCKLSIGGLIFIQLSVLLYTMSGICAKFAAGHSFLSAKFILYYGLEILVLAIYALVWQQVIKRYDLSLAYVNRAVAVFWSLLWAVLIFHESVSLKNILGVAVIFGGIWMVNTDEN